MTGSPSGKARVCKTLIVGSIPTPVSRKETMPDISMCTGGKCPLKETCFRFRAVPGMYQSFLEKPPFEDEKCDLFKPIQKFDKLSPDAAFDSR